MHRGCMAFLSPPPRAACPRLRSRTCVATDSGGASRAGVTQSLAADPALPQRLRGCCTMRCAMKRSAVAVFKLVSQTAAA